MVVDTMVVTAAAVGVAVVYAVASAVSVHFDRIPPSTVVLVLTWTRRGIARSRHGRTLQETA
jgi:hypothetical protein